MPRAAGDREAIEGRTAIGSTVTCGEEGCVVLCRVAAGLGRRVSGDDGGKIVSVTRSSFRLIGVPALVAVLVAVAALAVAGATPPSALRHPSAAPVARATVIVRPPIATATAMVGDAVRVELVACAASCGYTWRVTSGPAASVARYVSTKFRRSPASKGLVGGNEIETVTFRATGKGSTSIVFKYFPPGQNRKPSSSYRLELRVD